MSRDIVQLAFGQLTTTDQLVIQLLRLEDSPAVERTLKPAAVRILWPRLPTVVSPREFPEVAAVAVKLFAGASTELARHKARHKL
jgi:hypothetical protein